MRIYEHDNKKYLSVTSIVELINRFDSDGFSLWAFKNKLNPEWINKRSVELGERYHKYFENRFYGIDDWCDELIEPMDYKYKLAVDDFFKQGWEIISSEKEVFCDEFRYAGRYDAIGRNKSLNINNALLDFKTWGAWNKKLYKRNPEKIKKLSIQESMYCYALGDIEIPKFLVIPQINSKCVVEFVPTNTKWKDWINANNARIDKLLQANIEHLTCASNIV